MLYAARIASDTFTIGVSGGSMASTATVEVDIVSFESRKRLFFTTKKLAEK